MQSRSFLFLLFASITLVYSLSPTLHKLPGTHQSSRTEGYQPHRAENTADGCGLQRPSTAEWIDGVGEKFGGWMDYNWENYKSSNYSTFMHYMIGEFAPDVPASALECDGVGSCSIGSCQNIATDLSDFDRQMAYYAFEQVANIDHTYKVMYYATVEATSYMSNAHGALVESFSHAGNIAWANFKRHRTESIATSLITSLLLAVTGTAGFLSTFSLPMVLAEMQAIMMMGSRIMSAINSVQFKRGLGAASGSIGLVNNIYLGLNFAIHGWYNEVDVPGKVNGFFEKLFSGITHMKVQQVWKELHRLMEGDLNSNGTSLPDLLKTGAYIEQETGLRARLTDALEKAYFAVAVDALWSLDRTYILDTDLDHFDCTADPRGPPRNRVCLPERPGHVYWIYNIHGGEEGDRGHLKNAKVRSPVGLRKFVERSQDYHNITKEDIVRASLWAQEEHLVNDQGMLINKLPTKWVVNDTHAGGSLAGTFTIPICRNPKGEAISSVWSHKGRNYPCMCGEFSWVRNGGYSPEKDETKAFLEKTGFFASEDWHVFCSLHTKCKKDESVQYQFSPIEGAPNMVDMIQHPYQYCKHPNAHVKVGVFDAMRKILYWRHGHPDRDK